MFYKFTNMVLLLSADNVCCLFSSILCFDAVSWAAGRASGP